MELLTEREKLWLVCIGIAIGIAIALVLLVHIALAAEQDSTIATALLHAIPYFRAADTLQFDSLSVRHDCAIKYVSEIKENDCLYAVLEIFASNGDFCSRFGHQWRKGRPGESENIIFLDYHPFTEYRTCKICGVCQKRDTREVWK